jgi:hypothetical protein
MRWLRDWYTKWVTSDVPVPPPPAPQILPRQFVLVPLSAGEFNRAYWGKEGKGKMNGEPCVFTYRKGIVTVTLT